MTLPVQAACSQELLEGFVIGLGDVRELYQALRLLAQFKSAWLAFLSRCFVLLVRTQAVDLQLAP
jgi:hypothetical protein